MIIVFVLDVYDSTRNGTTVTARRFAEALRKDGHEVRVVSTGMPEKDKYVVKENHFPVLYHFCKKQGFVFAKAQKKVLKEAFVGADIVHLFLPLFLEKKAMKIAQKMGIPCTGAFHLQPENITFNIHMRKAEFLSRSIYSLMRRSFYDKLSHIHCPSEFIASQLRRHGYKAKLHIISNGISDDFRYNKNARNDGKFHILCIGRFSPEKRQDLLIRAVLASKYKNRIVLHFAGAGALENHLRRLSDRLPNKPDFNFYDKEKLIELINGCDLYVHASDVDIEAISCLEAIASGLVPVISDSDRSATSQFALDNRSLFKAGNHLSLMEKIHYWIENPEELEKMSIEYSKYPHEFRLNECVNKTTEMFKEAIAKNEIPDESNLSPYEAFRWGFYYLIALPILSVITHILFGIRFEGRKNLDGIVNGIVVCNHIHNLDSAMIACAATPNRMNYVTIEDNMRSPFSGIIVSLFGISTGVGLDGRKKFISESMRVLRNSEWLVIYPEGELIPYCEYLRPFKRGAFKLAAKADVPVVPMVITQQEPYGIWALVKNKPLLKVKIGEPIFPKKGLDERENCEYLLYAAHESMNWMLDQDRPGMETTAEEHTYR